MKIERIGRFLPIVVSLGITNFLISGEKASTFQAERPGYIKKSESTNSSGETVYTYTTPAQKQVTETLSSSNGATVATWTDVQTGQTITKTTTTSSSDPNTITNTWTNQNNQVLATQTVTVDSSTGTRSTTWTSNGSAKTTVTDSYNSSTGQLSRQWTWTSPSGQEISETKENNQTTGSFSYTFSVTSPEGKTVYFTQQSPGMAATTSSTRTWGGPNGNEFSYEITNQEGGDVIYSLTGPQGQSATGDYSLSSPGTVTWTGSGGKTVTETYTNVSGTETWTFTNSNGETLFSKTYDPSTGAYSISFINPQSGSSENLTGNSSSQRVWQSLIKESQQTIGQTIVTVYTGPQNNVVQENYDMLTNTYTWIGPNGETVTYSLPEWSNWGKGYYNSWLQMGAT